MSEVEVSLIAQNLQFRKIFRLPKSRWAQIRDRVICVPVPCQNIKNTISKLPRTPTDSGLIGVNWKRRVAYKNTHLTQYVDTNRLFEVLDYLIEYNPLYINSTIDRDFLERCKSQDPSGHEFFIDTSPQEDQLNSDDDDMFLRISENIQEMNIGEESNGSLSDGELERVEEEYQEYAKTDPIKKFQFDYDEHVALTREDPTAVFDANKTQRKIITLRPIISLI